MASIAIRALTAGALVFGLAVAGAASAQTWRMQPEGSDSDAFALVEWPSGIYMISRCKDQDFVMAMTLAVPLQGGAAEVGYAFDGGAPVQARWTLSGDGGGLIIGDATDFARSMVRARALEMTVSDGRGPRQRYQLPLAPPARDLREVLTACDQPLS